MPRLVTKSGFSPAWRPSRPASHNATRKAIATSTPYVWRNERWRISGYMGGLAFGSDQLDEEHRGADIDRGIGDVESGPLVGANVEEKEVGHAAEDGAVEQIPGGAAEDEAEAPE